MNKLSLFIKAITTLMIQGYESMTFKTDSNVAKALVDKAEQLRHQRKFSKSEACYYKVIERFGDSTDTAVIEQVCRALSFIVAVQDQNCWNPAVYEEMIVRFQSRTELPLVAYVAQAMFYKATVLDDQGYEEAAREGYDAVVARFGDAKESVLLDWVVAALLNKANSLMYEEEPNFEEIMACYDEVITRFGDSAETVLLAGVAEALIDKGRTLHHYRKSIEQVIACYDEVIIRFAHSTEPDLLKWLACARRYKENIAV